MRYARETDDLRPLWNTAFQPDDAFFARDYRPERALICCDGGIPVSMLHMLPRTLLLGRQPIRAGYVMGVATDPAYRRRGLAGNLLNAAIESFSERRFDCVTLIPASGTLALYYQRFGLSMRGRRPMTGGGYFDGRPASNDDIPKLTAFYDAAFPSRVERDIFEWETILLTYAVRIGVDGYTAGDERGVLERVPVPADSPESECAACILPLNEQAETLLVKNRPYINLLYT
jgi:GNAT superfamily N-acetyltransferase